MRQILFFCLAALCFCRNSAVAQAIPEIHRENRSYTYDEVIRHYELLDKKFRNAQLLTYGLTDVGKPLQLFVLSGIRGITPELAKKNDVPVLFILNGIHPGEPDGIDASLHLSEWLLTKADSLLERIAICIVPSYNIDGMLNRGCCSRANQDGPEAYGFRGNGRNLDLNRDFIKLDSDNARSLAGMLRTWDPDFFIDTHVSNGADYQYTLTLLPTLAEKLSPVLRTFLQQEIWARSTEYMRHSGFDVTPYVDTYKDIPDSGLVAFTDLPRFSSGYTALFNCIGIVTETHMLKPFPQRVESTLHFLKWASIYMHYQGKKMHKLRKAANDATAVQEWFPIQWAHDVTRYDEILFKGYEAVYKTSNVTGLPRLYYDRSRPYEKNIRYYNRYAVTDSVKKPAAYIIPQAWDEIVRRMEWNHIPLEKLRHDTVMEVEAYRITGYETSKRPYEGHYIHSQVKTETVRISQQFRAGDIVIRTGTAADYFIVSVLEPRAADSYFCWGFFDSVLQQKEWFSDYVWEDKAEELLRTDENLRRTFEEQKNSDPDFAKSSFSQLYFIYRHSPYYEPSHSMYPVFRLH